ncbi:LacI family DNA-binding transcriptional regulator [Chondrinema litorale]|uniref:LacI family DNA-binding transcriptional regulator n=1 Tax=Chondrinema litorale TaxID=2994555 RepID=UPI002542BA30|nr:LacI family DNA-binding transcriptional regulator [Chondrinema litorale]UZR97331.1 LacI family DNA-binding transcriptional regulator [Chondrinema litorale]
MAKTKISINDIATKLNISKTTVSFILNGKAKEKRISDKLVAKVLKKVEELGYQPNQFAKGLRTGRTNILGLMVEDISNPFFASIAKEIEEKAYQNKYKIVYCSTENDKERAKEFLTMFSTLGVDGCIISPTMGMEEHIKKMVDTGMNVILFDRKFENTSNNVVKVNNIEGVYSAVTHLVDRGYKQIALVALTLDSPEKEERIIGYKNAVTDYGLDAHIFPLPFKNDYLDYVEDIMKILEKNKNLDSIIFSTNYLGISGLEAINNLGLKIPDDLAIISFDDHDLFRIHKPNITVVSQPIKQLSHTAMDMLLERLQCNNKDKEESEHKTVTLCTNLIVRESTEYKKK